MTSDQKFGKAINILSFMNSKEIVVDDSELDKIFGHPEIQDRKVVIMSIIGAFRGGKSFFLDYCLRFFYAHFPSINNPNKVTSFIFKKDDTWMGEPDEPLTGFSWRSGTKRDTTGIIMWSDVFLHTIDRTGEKIAIFVMDTQGLFDNDSTAESNSKIFALGTLIPSIQVLNIKGIIQENQLEYLQFATEYAINSAMDIVNKKAFQSLTFLMRDWDNNDEYKYGIDGGSQYLKQLLKPRRNENKKLQSVRKSLSSSFDQTRCCLLPHPGRVVASNGTYDGSWFEMDVDFKNELKSSIEDMLIPTNMVIKKINSKEVTGKEMKDYIQKYFEIFQSSNTMRVLNIYESTVELYMNNIIEKCLNDYKLRMFENKDLIGNDNNIVHDSCKAKGLEMYDKQRKIGSLEYQKSCKTILFKKIDGIYEEFETFAEHEEQLKAALDKELQEKEELKEAIKYVKYKLEELQKSPSTQGYTELKDVLETRLDKDIKKLNEIEKKLREREAFRRKLRNYGISAFIGGIMGWALKDIKPLGVLHSALDKVRKVLALTAAPVIVQNQVCEAVSKVPKELLPFAETTADILLPAVETAADIIMPAVETASDVILPSANIVDFIPLPSEYSTILGVVVTAAITIGGILAIILKEKMKN
ncbi:hypothetical protein ACKWTF_015701 [Chironomus riparius]